MSEFSYDGFEWAQIDAPAQRVMDGGPEGLVRDPDTVYSYYPIVYVNGANLEVWVVKYLRTPFDVNGREVNRVLVHAFAPTVPATDFIGVKIGMTGGVIVVAIGSYIGAVGWLWIYSSVDGGKNYTLWHSTNAYNNTFDLALRCGGGNPYEENKGRVYVITTAAIHYFNPEGGVGWLSAIVPANTGNLALFLKDRIQDDVLYYMTCNRGLGAKGTIRTIRALDTAVPVVTTIYTTTEDCYECKDGMQFKNDKLIVAFTRSVGGLDAVIVTASHDWGNNFLPELSFGIVGLEARNACMDYDPETNMILIVATGDDVPPPNLWTFFVYIYIGKTELYYGLNRTYLTGVTPPPPILATPSAYPRSVIFDRNKVHVLIHDSTTALWWFSAKFESLAPQKNEKARPYPENRRKALPRVTNFTETAEIYIDTNGDEIPDEWVKIPVTSMSKTGGMNEISSLSVTVPNISSLGKTDIQFQKYTLLDSIYAGMPIRIKMEWETEIESAEFIWFYGLLYEFPIRVSSGSNNIEMSFYDKFREASNMRCYNSGTGVVLPDNPSNPAEITLQISEFLDQIGIDYFQDCVVGAAPDDTILFDLSFDRTETILDAIRRFCEYAKYYFYWDYEYDFLYFRHWKPFNMDYVHHAFVIGDSKYPEYKEQIPDRFYNSSKDNIYPIFESDVELSVERVVNAIFSADNNTPPNTSFVADTDSQSDYGDYMTDGTDKENLNTGTCVNALATLTVINQNKVNRDSRPWIKATIKTIGQKSVNPGDVIFINDRVGGVDKSENRIWRVEKKTDTITSGVWHTSLEIVSQRSGRPCSDEVIEASPTVNEWLYCGKKDGVMRYAGQTFTIPGSGNFCKWAVVMDAPKNRPPPIKAVIYNVDAASGLPTTFVAESTTVLEHTDIHAEKYSVFRFDNPPLAIGPKYYIVPEMLYEPVDGQYYKVGVDDAGPYIGGEVVEMFGDQLLIDIAQAVIVNRDVGVTAGGNEVWRGNTFTAPKDADIIALEQWVSAIVNNPTDLLIHMYDTLLGLPNNPLNQTYALAFATITVGAYNKFSMSAFEAVLNGIVYGAICETNLVGPGANNRYQIGCDNTNPYALGQHISRSGIGYPPPLPWNPVAGVDSVMRVYETGPSYPPEHPIIEITKDLVCKFFNEGT